MKRMFFIIFILIAFTFAYACNEADDDDDDNNDDNVDDDDTGDDDDNDDDNSNLTSGFERIPSGSFTMGSSLSEIGRANDEKQHEVTLTNDFEMSVFETTQENFALLMGWNPSFFGPNGGGMACGDDCPVESVSWYDVAAFANELSLAAGYEECYLLSDVVCEDASNVDSNYMNCMNSEQGGIDSASVSLHDITSIYDCEGYRLPTESEWEYSARAGTISTYHNGEYSNKDYLHCEVPFHLTDIAWYCGNNAETTQTVGQKASNDWGLHDMSGNVWEWNGDWYASSYPMGPVTDPAGAASGSTKVIRGCGWSDYARNCRSAARNRLAPGDRYAAQGFRLVRSLPDTKSEGEQ